MVIDPGLQWCSLITSVTAAAATAAAAMHQSKTFLRFNSVLPTQDYWTHLLLDLLSAGAYPDGIFRI
jgi:hypothetical protein